MGGGGERERESQTDRVRYRDRQMRNYMGKKSDKVYFGTISFMLREIKAPK